MRERLIATCVGVTVLTILVFAVVRSYAVSDLVTATDTAHTQRSAALMAETVAQRERTGAPVTPRFLGRLVADGERVEYRRPSGRAVVAAAPDFPTPGESAALLTGSQRVSGGGTLVLSTVARGSHLGNGVLQLGLLGLVLAALAGILGWVAARLLSRPFRQLAAIAAEFGRGRLDVEVPHFAVPEAEALAEAMRDAQREVTQLVQRERQFAGNASHQLKTPLTALRLELEDLALWPQTAPDVREQLGRGLREVERLTATIDELLQLARGRRVLQAREVDLCELVRDTAARWRPLAHKSGRRIVDLTPGQLPLRLPPGAVTQVLDVLLANASEHGQGTISVTVSAVDTYVRLQVADEGRTPVRDDVFRRGTSGRGDRTRGIGLAVATEIAEALGGYLRLEPGAPTTFSLMIPRSDAAASRALAVAVGSDTGRATAGVATAARSAIRDDEPVGAARS